MVNKSDGLQKKGFIRSLFDGKQKKPEYETKGDDSAIHIPKLSL